ncbi:MAG: RNA 2',3'-cyclic phosphodiesterase [Spirochaetes bacterium]|nr:RNA 2',3'-cyclic phosphodiesterase [Spirochaetota bacterium]
MNDQKELFRCFIAIDLPERIKTIISDMVMVVKKDFSLPIRWVKEENYHITLKFLAEISQNRIDRIKSFMKDLERDRILFSMNIEEAGVFPPKGAPRVVWLGFKEATGNLIRIFKTLDGSLKRIGFKPEKRDFKPHITLARIKYLKQDEGNEFYALLNRLKEKAIGYAERQFSINSLTLFKSELTPQGSVYSRLFEVTGP